MATYGLHMMAFHMQVAPPLLPGSDGPALSLTEDLQAYTARVIINVPNFPYKLLGLHVVQGFH